MAQHGWSDPWSGYTLHLGALMAISKLGLAINSATKMHRLDNRHYVSSRSRLRYPNRYLRPHHGSVD
jgi:hypothetical protein